MFSKYNIIIPNGKTSGEIVTTCPECSEGRKKKTDKCLGVNLDKKVWRCNHCGWAGGLKIEREEKKIYSKPVWKNNTTLSDKLVKWFELRGIRQTILEKMKVGEGSEYMPQISKEINTIQFNYFKDAELINIKYRDGQKNFKLFKDAELVFYNIDSIKESKEVYITEGEIDCLSLIAAGYESVVSVPNGANTGKNNLQYIDNCFEYFNDKKIHIAVDNDIAGRKLRQDIAERFGIERCDYIEFGDFKDANELLVKSGIEGIQKVCVNPIKFPLQGVYTISDYSDAIDDMYINGLDKGVDLKIPNFELNIVKGYITTITGIPSHGKSDWVDYMTLMLKVQHGWNGAFYSPENKPTQLHFSKMARKLIGKHWDGNNRMSEGEVNLVKRYLDNSFWFLKPEKDFSLTSILTQVRQLQQRYGCDFFVIDAWNKLEHKHNDSQTDYIGRCLDELAIFCELNNVHCFLVAHPTKIKKENGIYETPTLYNIAGSANFYNKTDNGICVYRDFEKDIAIVYRQKIKFDHWGKEGSSEYKYDLNSKRYYPDFNPDLSNWITKENKQEVINYPSQMQPNINFYEVDKPDPF